MPKLTDAEIERLRAAWRAASGEDISTEEAWDMATRILCLFDALLSVPVDNSFLTDRPQECDQLSDGDPNRH